MKTAISILAGLALAASLSAPAGARPCGDAVVADWSDGRVDGRYAPPCYADAIESLPEDVRSYSTAVDDITRALQARIRETRPPAPPPAAATEPALLGSTELSAVADAVPLPLLWVAAIGAVLALAGLGWLVGRTIRWAGHHRGARPVGQW